jgi:hypothetical protein
MTDVFLTVGSAPIYRMHGLRSSRATSNATCPAQAFAGSRPPATLFFYSPDRKGEHPQAHLKDFRGVIHADGYPGFNELFTGGRIVEADCWAHVRRKFFDVHAATGSPIAKEALDRIGQLYAVEKAISGSPSDRRQRQRQLPVKANSRGTSLLGRHHPAPALAQIRARCGFPLYAGALDRARSLLRRRPSGARHEGEAWAWTHDEGGSRRVIS